MEKYLVPLSQKITGRETPKAWTQVFQAIPASEEEKKSRGFLFAVVDLKSGPDFDCSVAGKLVLNSLKEEYYSHSSGGILAGLEKALDVSGQKLITLVSSSPTIKEEVDFNIVVVALWGAVAYVAKMGQSYFGVYRQGNLHTIDHPSSNMIKTASGLLHEKDILVLATEKFKEVLSDSETEAAFKKSSLAEVGKALSNLVKEQTRTTALLVQLGVEEVTEGEETVTFTKNILDIDIYPGVRKPFNNRVNKLFVNLKNVGLKVRRCLVEFGRFGPRKASKLLFTVRGLQKIFRPLLSFVPREKLPFSRFFGLKKGTNFYQTKLKKHKILFLVFAFGLILVGSVFWNYQQRNLAERKEKFTTLVDLAKSKYNDARSLQSLNPLRAKTLLTDAKDSLDQALKLGIEDQQVATLRSSVEELLRGGTTAYRMTDPPLFYELNSLNTAAKGNGLRLVGSDLLVLDKNQSALYFFSPKTKEAKTLIESKVNLPQPNFLTSYQDNLYLFSATAGLIRYHLKTGLIKPLVDLDSVWQQITDLASYHDNLYLLDAKKNVIWKYVPVEDGYSSGKNFLSEKEKTDLTKGVSLAVDGTVWVLTSEGDILKFSRGEREEFRVVGLDGGFKNPTKIYTEENLNNLYVLDQENKRVVVVSKSGEYLSQYISDKFSDAVSIAVDEAGKKLFVLTLTKIYNVELR